MLQKWERSDCLLCKNVYSTPCGGGWANTTAEITTFAMMMWDRPEDCYCFYRGCPFLCNWLGCMGYFYSWVGKLIIILEIPQDSVFCFQAYVTMSRSIKQIKRGLNSISQSVRSFAIWFVLQHGVHCKTDMLSWYFVRTFRFVSMDTWLGKKLKIWMRIFFFTLQNVFLIYQSERLARQSIDDGQSHRYFYLIFLCQPSASNPSKQLGQMF